MKKILVVALCTFLLCGCGKKEDDWKKTIQLSTLEIKNDYIVGQIKNLKDKAYKLTLTIELKSGSLTEEKTCYETIKPNETRNLKCILASNKINDTYTAEIKTIEITEKEIPELKEGKIDRDTLEYHFEEIFDAHTLNFVSLALLMDSMQYPFIDEIEYEKDKIVLSGSFTQENNFFSYVETFNTNTSKLSSAYFYTSVNNDEKFTDSLLTKISLMPSINLNTGDSITINRTLKRTDIKEGYCINAGSWCISTRTDDTLNSYLILPKH